MRIENHFRQGVKGMDLWVGGLAEDPVKGGQVKEHLELGKGVKTTSFLDPLLPTLTDKDEKCKHFEVFTYI